MEKRAVIDPEYTPPEDNSKINELLLKLQNACKEKHAEADDDLRPEYDLAQLKRAPEAHIRRLERHVTKRAADVVEEKLR